MARTREVKDKQNKRNRERRASDPDYRARVNANNRRYKLKHVAKIQDWNTTYNEAVKVRRKVDLEFRNQKNAYKRKLRERPEDKEKVRVYKANNRPRIISYDRKAKYKITQEQFDALFLSQGSKCAICGRQDSGWKGRWHLDHDHSCCDGAKSCGKCIRGILCQPCNLLLARAKDSVETLAGAIKYLSRDFRTEVQQVFSQNSDIQNVA